MENECNQTKAALKSPYNFTGHAVYPLLYRDKARDVVRVYDAAKRKWGAPTCLCLAPGESLLLTPVDRGEFMAAAANTSGWKEEREVYHWGPADPEAEPSGHMPALFLSRDDGTLRYYPKDSRSGREYDPKLETWKNAPLRDWSAQDGFSSVPPLDFIDKAELACGWYRERGWFHKLMGVARAELPREAPPPPKWVVEHKGPRTVIRKGGTKGVATWDGTGRESRLMGLLVASLKALGLRHHEIERILRESAVAYPRRNK